MEERELIGNLKSLAPMLEEHAEKAERSRKPVDSVMKAIEGTQAYRYFVPKKYGGFEFSLEGFMEVGVTLGGADVATAWVVTFCMEHNWLIGLYNQQAQDHIFGNQQYLIAPGALAPKGRATKVDGGYRLSGHWEWGTGVMHADWVLVGALTDHDGPPELCMYALPIADAAIIDTWQMSGMAGTGSNDIVIEDAFVPDYLRQNLAEMRAGDSPGARYHQTATYRMPMLPVLGLTAAAPAVGCAIRTVERFRERLQERTVYGTQDKQSERALAQSRLAHLTVRAQTLNTTLQQIARDVTVWGESGEICPDIERAQFRVRIGHIVREARNIVREVVEVSGAHAHNLSNAFGRALRDLETLSCHTVFDLDIATESYGRLLLGLPSNTPL
ncbi:MAG: 3-hydroxy-9,10-secoandrosta-1,3,5(10)-triene-9,17-dione monooxygenase [Candidatus Azotimanducaceae bacterium]|jgi:3-hydroxy-9,10-secoandrosta-1,3,5(10)-triene-9,17-dione monooxygenase